LILVWVCHLPGLTLSFGQQQRHLQTTENQLLEANKDGRDVLEEKYRLSNEKVLLLSEELVFFFTE